MPYHFAQIGSGALLFAIANKSFNCLAKALKPTRLSSRSFAICDISRRKISLSTTRIFHRTFFVSAWDQRRSFGSSTANTVVKGLTG